jgi:hypothetical protein
MADTIKIGGKDIPRTVQGAFLRLELSASQRFDEDADDVRFLRGEWLKLRAENEMLRKEATCQQ